MGKANILVVEDEAIIAMELENSLRSFGYTITSVVNTGEEAIAKAAEEKPDIVLMDIRIKGELDGIEAADIIRSRFEIPVVFSTAYLDEERISRAKITMPFGYVLKPIQERDLKITLEMALYISKIDSKRKAAEIKVKESEIKYRTMFDMSPIGVQISDLKGRVSYSNKAHQTIHGLPENRILGRYLWTFNMQEEAKQNEKEGYFEFIKTGHPDKHYGLGIDASGKVYHFIINRVLLKDSHNQPYAVCSFITDITDLKQAEEDITSQKEIEEKLKESEARYRGIVDDIPLFICQYLQGGEIVLVNKAYCNFFKKSPEELIGKTFLSLIPEEDRESVSEIITSLDINNPTLTHEHNVILPDGKIGRQRWTNRAIFSSQGQISSYQSIGENITER